MTTRLCFLLIFFFSAGGTGPTGDTGWGCMLRCGQMIFAQALTCRHLGRGQTKTFTLAYFMIALQIECAKSSPYKFIYCWRANPLEILPQQMADKKANTIICNCNIVFYFALGWKKSLSSHIENSNTGFLFIQIGSGILIQPILFTCRLVNLLFYT